VIVEQVDVPVYSRIGDEAKHLRELGMSDRAIGQALDVSDKTVTKALRSLGFTCACEAVPWP